MKKLFQALFIACLYTAGNNTLTGINITLDKADPAPFTSTELPISFAYDNYKEATHKGHIHSESGIKLSVMPFYSRASKGTDINGTKNSQLGDLAGKWNLLAILNTTTPSGQTMPNILKGQSLPTGSLSFPSDRVTDQVLHALQHVSSGSSSGITYTGGATPTAFTSLDGLKSLQSSKELFGFMTVPAKYRKHGAKFEITGAAECGLGFTVSTGFASISQKGSFNNAIKFGNVNVTTTTSGTSSATTVTDAAYYMIGDTKTILENPFNTSTVTDQQWYAALKALSSNTSGNINSIADAIGLNLADFNETGFEDLRGEIFWRKAIKLNTKDITLFVPFVTAFGTLDLGNPRIENQPLSVPFGNNGHKSYGGSAGFTLDFGDSFEIGAAIGGASFTTRKVKDMYVPNASDQSGIYPFKTDVNVNPGATWYISLLMNSYHFEEDTSFYMQYVYANHNQDRINLITADSTFKPDVLANKTNWSNHMANLGLTYDVSPGISIGCAAQIPLKQINSYRNTALSLSISASH